MIKFTGFNAQTESLLNAIEASLLSKLKAELSENRVGKVSPASNIDTGDYFAITIGRPMVMAIKNRPEAVISFIFRSAFTSSSAGYPVNAASLQY